MLQKINLVKASQGLVQGSSQQLNRVENDSKPTKPPSQKGPENILQRKEQTFPRNLAPVPGAAQHMQAAPKMDASKCKKPSLAKSSVEEKKLMMRKPDNDVYGGKCAHAG